MTSFVMQSCFPADRLAGWYLLVVEKKKSSSLVCPYNYGEFTDCAVVWFVCGV